MVLLNSCIWRIKGKTAESEKRMEHIDKNCRRKIKRPRKRLLYMMRDQELKMKERKRASRKIKIWRRRQQYRLGRKIEIMAVIWWFIKRFSGKTKNKRRRINKEKHVTTRIKIYQSVRHTYVLEKEKPWKCYLEKRQQSSPAWMFAGLRSNRRYKPRDLKERTSEFKHIVLVISHIQPVAD